MSGIKKWIIGKSKWLNGKIKIGISEIIILRCLEVGII